ncbi:MAG: NFACT RNA binding domain-containing protein, partial [archaeon]
MDVEIYYELSSGKNAELKYKTRDKYKLKLEGLKKAIKIIEAKDNVAQKKISDNKKLINIDIKTRAKQWFEKFRFSYSINGFLIIGGRDSKDNELIVKKHMEDNDIYFHADIIGAPHTILKTEGKVVKIEDKIDAAIIAACYSSAWKNKIYSLDVYSALPSQVSKSPESGEYLTTGAFVIRGKKEYFKKCDLKLFIGIKDDVLIAGSENSIKKNCKDYIGL